MAGHRLQDGFFRHCDDAAFVRLHELDGAYPFTGLVRASTATSTADDVGRAGHFRHRLQDRSGRHASTTLHTFSANDGAQPFGTLVQGADGSFYGTANWGGPSGYGEIFKVDGAGTFAIVHAFGYSEGTYSMTGLTLGRDGYFYGTGSSGGAGYGTVYRADAAGNVTVLHAFNNADGGHPNAAVTLGTDGFLYGTTVYGGSADSGRS
jgi:uncharacterized repeat protein (TIGR03803 family)